MPSLRRMTSHLVLHDLLVGRRRLDLPQPRRTTGRKSIAGLGVLALAATLGACGSPSASSVSLPSSLPSVDASAAASAAAGAALTALGEVDTAVAANQSSGALTADDASTLTQLTAAARSALQSGDTTAARTALDGLRTKVDSFASRLSGDAGTQLKSALAALKAALPAS